MLIILGHFKNSQFAIHSQKIYKNVLRVCFLCTADLFRSELISLKFIFSFLRLFFFSYCSKEQFIPSITITGITDNGGFHDDAIEITFTEHQASKTKIKPSGGKLFVINCKQLPQDKTIIKHATEIKNNTLAATIMDLKVISHMSHYY